MKKILHFLLLMVVFSPFATHAQNTQGKTADVGRLSLTPVVSDEVSAIPAEAKNYLANKLQQIATLNGLGGKAHNPWFVITANISVVSKDVLAGPPQMIAQNLEVTLYIADYRQKTVLSTLSLSVKGVGTNETKAFMEAIKNIKAVNPEIKLFVENGKNKIIEFYNSNCDFVLTDAETKCAQKKYQEAIFTLTAVPDVCKDCYMQANKAVGPIYQLYADFNCKVMLNMAQNAWNARPNSAGAEQAARALSTIDPEAACYADAKQFMTQIAQKVLEDEKRDVAMEMKVHDDKVDLEKQRIEAARAVGVAYGTNQPQQSYNFKGWLW
ncbi:MAG: hypothetical protein WCO02_04360 [Bacteroidota bacterium]